MTDNYLTYEHGQLTLDGVLLPGVIISQDIDCNIKFDESELDTGSGTKKTLIGFTDSEISLSFVLLSDDSGTCYDKLNTIDTIFKSLDNNSIPKIFTISTAQIMARNIYTVVFSGLKSSENSDDDTITVTLKFTEHEPTISEADQNRSIQTGSSEDSADNPSGDVAKDEQDISIFMQGLKDGST